MPLIRSLHSFLTVSCTRGLRSGVVFFALMVSLLVVGAALPTLAATDTVTSLADDGSAGTLRSVLAAAAPGDTIVFNVTGTITLDTIRNVLFIGTPVTISGPGAGNLAINGNNSTTVFQVAYGVGATISGVTIENGNGQGETYPAGGIFNQGTVILIGCTFSGNNGVISSGNAVHPGTTAVTVNNSTFTGNTGVAISSYGPLSVTGSTFSGNTGGGISNNYSGGTLNVTNSTFANNGGYAISNNGALSVLNSTFFVNGTYGPEGGISNSGAATVTFSTFSGNNALYMLASSPGTLTLKNSIVSGTSSPNCYAGASSGNIIDGGGNLSWPDTSCPGINVDPLLGPLGNNGGMTPTVPLPPTSPAVNAIPVSACTGPLGYRINVDQRGVARPQGSDCDMGAYELQGASQTTVNVTLFTSPAGATFSVDGTAYAAAQSFTWTIGSSHTIATTSPQALGPGVLGAFAGWSDGGALSHSVTVNASTTSYTAEFNPSYLLTTVANPARGGSVAPASGTYYPAGTVVNLTATANTGYIFANWTGNVANVNSASTTVTMGGPETVTANFNRQTLHFVGAGNSILWQDFAITAFNDLGPAAVTACQTNNPGHVCALRHWSTGNTAYVKDSRTNYVGASPQSQYANTWVVWVEDTTANTTTDLWSAIALDDTQAVRNYLAAPHAILGLASGASGSAGVNSISPSFFAGAATDSPLDATAYAVVNGQPLTAGLTSIRPEDALLATYRALGSTSDGTGNPGDTVPALSGPYGPPYWDIYSFALGYSGFNAAGQATSQGIGNYIYSGEPGSQQRVQPVLFGLPGFTDPLSGGAVSNTIQVFPVGESPILFAVNRSNPNGFGQIIASYVASPGNCYGPGLTNCQPDNTGQPASYVSDGSYYVRNVWDQHPWPAQANVYPGLDFPATGVCSNVANQGLPECHVVRRPLGNLFSGGDCEGDNAAFTWPLDPSAQGLRAQIPNRQVFPITLFPQDPLSGAYTTTEYTEIRRYGTPGGSNAGPGSDPNVTWYERPAYISQESNVVQPGDSALNQLCQADFGEVNSANEGYRIRAIGNGEALFGPGTPHLSPGDGLQNTPDSLAYSFWSFSGFSSLAANANYGYLMIDSIDPLFDNYENAFGNSSNVQGEPLCEGAGAAGTLCPLARLYPTAANPGQPASPANPLSWGQFPACTPGGLGCTASAIWGTNPSYPHLRDGSYPAWSELRLLCDTAAPNCTTTEDPLGAEGLMQHLQDDIHNNATGSVADFLPFSDDHSFGVGGYGDVAFVRDHFSFAATSDANLGAGLPPFPLTSPTTSHQSNVQVVFACNGGVPLNGSTPLQECGGDVGGAIVPAGTAAATDNLQ